MRHACRVGASRRKVRGAGKNVARDAFAPLRPGRRAVAPGRAGGGGVAYGLARSAFSRAIEATRVSPPPCRPEGTGRRDPGARGGELHGRPPRAAERNRIPPFVSAATPAETFSTQALAPPGARRFERDLTEIVRFAAPSHRGAATRRGLWSSKAANRFRRLPSSNDLVVQASRLPECQKPRAPAKMANFAARHRSLPPASRQRDADLRVTATHYVRSWPSSHILWFSS